MLINTEFKLDVIVLDVQLSNPVLFPIISIQNVILVLIVLATCLSVYRKMAAFMEKAQISPQT